MGRKKKKKGKKKMSHRLRAIIMIFLTGWAIWLLFTLSVAKKLPSSLTEIFPLVRFPPPIVVIIFLSAILLAIGAAVGYVVEKILKRMEK